MAELRSASQQPSLPSPACAPAPEPPSSPAVTGYTTKTQWVVVALCALANLVNQADRIVMSVAIVPMAGELNLSAYDQGWILSSFSYGYIITQVFAGPLARKYGAGTVLACALAGWCSLTVLTPIIAVNGVPFLLGARALMGIFEGFCWPSTYTWISSTVDRGRRSRSFALLITGGTLGQLIALGVSPRLEWPQMFLVFGLFGFAWITLYCLSPVPIARDPTTPVFAAAKIYAKMLRLPSVVAILAAHFAHNWGHSVLVSWLPTYLHTVLGTPKTSLGIAAIPMLLNCLVSPLYGWFSDYLLNSCGWPLLRVRRVLSALGLLIPAAMFYQVPYATTESSAISLICVCYLAQGCLGSGVFANHADIVPKHAGMAFGLGNTIATLPALVIGPFTAYLISHGNNWTPVFHIAAGLNVVGAAWYLRYSDTESVDYLLEDGARRRQD
eukprot:TRINITY_DN25740_c0_g1_i1.p2 TRINITY_DN25740_c0_g1~~TRINITY_DN25740_c0_g1_i1.p2  ORF type:complete len:442 (+),score=115.64 TRINITY_DN25740_c0_g1_i1:106-1431(+)